MTRKVTVESLLRYLEDELEVWFPLTKKAVYRRLYNSRYISWEDYFPSVLKRVANRLQRRGVVEISEAEGQWIVKITNKGRKEVLKYKWADFRPKSGKWDRKWRMVFFDVPEKEKRRRDDLRGFLKMLGMEQLQESVFVSPYDVSGEVRYLREILDVPHAVKLAVLESVENEDELKKIFGVR